MTPDRYIFDAFAMLTLFGGEPGAVQVRTILQQPDNDVQISSINVGEVYYTLLRRRGLPAAQAAEMMMFQQPNVQIVEPSWDHVRTAAEIKARGRLSYADCFAVGLARTLAAPLVTGDPELAPFDQRGEIRIIWLPRR